MKRITAYLTMIFALACCVQVQAQEAGDPGEAFVDGKLIWSQTKTAAADPENPGCLYRPAGCPPGRASPRGHS